MDKDKKKKIFKTMGKERHKANGKKYVKLIFVGVQLLRKT